MADSGLPDPGPAGDPPGAEQPTGPVDQGVALLVGHRPARPLLEARAGRHEPQPTRQWLVAQPPSARQLLGRAERASGGRGRRDPRRPSGAYRSSRACHRARDEAGVEPPGGSELARPEHTSGGRQPAQPKVVRVTGEPMGDVEAARGAQREVARQPGKRNRARVSVRLSGRPHEQPVVEHVEQPHRPIRSDQEGIRPGNARPLPLETDVLRAGACDDRLGRAQIAEAVGPEPDDLRSAENADRLEAGRDPDRAAALPVMDDRVVVEPVPAHGPNGNDSTQQSSLIVARPLAFLKSKVTRVNARWRSLRTYRNPLAEGSVRVSYSTSTRSPGATSDGGNSRCATFSLAAVGAEGALAATSERLPATSTAIIREMRATALGDQTLSDT